MPPPAATTSKSPDANMVMMNAMVTGLNFVLKSTILLTGGISFSVKKPLNNSVMKVLRSVLNKLVLMLKKS